MNTQNIVSHDELYYEAIQSSISQKIFHISKCLSCNTEKNITVEHNKKRMNITNFINMYTNIYIYIYIYIPTLYVTKMTQIKNDSINSCY